MTIVTDDFASGVGGNWNNFQNTWTPYSHGVRSSVALAWTSWNANSFGQSQYAKIRIFAFDDTGFSGGGPAVRITEDGTNGYYAYAYDNGTEILNLARYDNGSGTVIATKNMDLNTDDILEIRAIGDILTVYVNDVEELSFEDNTVTGSRIGIISYNTGSNAFALDDFEGGDFDEGGGAVTRDYPRFGSFGFGNFGMVG